MKVDAENGPNSENKGNTTKIKVQIKKSDADEFMDKYKKGVMDENLLAPG